MSDRYGIKDSTQYKLRQNGEIPFIKVGGSIRYSKEMIDLWLIDNTEGSEDIVQKYKELKKWV